MTYYSHGLKKMVLLSLPHFYNVLNVLVISFEFLKETEIISLDIKIVSLIKFWRILPRWIFFKTWLMTRNAGRLNGQLVKNCDYKKRQAPLTKSGSSWEMLLVNWAVKFVQILFEQLNSGDLHQIACFPAILITIRFFLVTNYNSSAWL